MSKIQRAVEEVVEVSVQTSTFGPCKLTFTRISKEADHSKDNVYVECDKDLYHQIRVFKERGRETWAVEVIKRFTNGRTMWSRCVAHECRTPELAFQLGVQVIWQKHVTLKVSKTDRWNWGSRQAVDPSW